MSEERYLVLNRVTWMNSFDKLDAVPLFLKVNGLFLKVSALQNTLIGYLMIAS